MRRELSSRVRAVRPRAAVDWPEKRPLAQAPAPRLAECTGRNSTEPRIPTFTDAETFHLRTDLRDLANNFMAEDKRQFRVRQLTSRHMKIGATDRTRPHLHEQLTRGWARRWHFRALERSTRRFEKHRAHIEKRAYTNDGVCKSHASCCRNFPDAAW